MISFFLTYLGNADEEVAPTSENSQESLFTSISEKEKNDSDIIKISTPLVAPLSEPTETKKAKRRNNIEEQEMQPMKKQSLFKQYADIDGYLKKRKPRK